MKRRIRNPIIPGTLTERTGTGAILRRAAAEINVRFAGLAEAVVATFERIPTYSVNEASVLYALTPEQMQLLSGELQASLDAYIAKNGSDVYRFWWSPYVADANQLGAAQAVANLTGLSEAYAAARTLQSVVFSDAYRNRVGIAQTKSYEHWVGQSAPATTFRDPPSGSSRSAGFSISAHVSPASASRRTSAGSACSIRCARRSRDLPVKPPRSPPRCE